MRRGRGRYDNQLIRRGRMVRQVMREKERWWRMKRRRSRGRMIEER
jgi:hypothetical protein